MEKEKSKEQIIRIDDKNSFVEVLSPMFTKGKVILNLLRYNPDTYKRVSEVKFYIDIPAFLVFSKEVEFGLLRRKLDAEKQSAIQENRYPKSVWEATPSGTAKEILAKQGRSRLDGKDEARALRIFPATKSPVLDLILEAVKGPGEKTGTGIIIPKFNYKDGLTERVSVAMSYNKLQELCAITNAHIQAMLCIGWLKEGFSKEPESIRKTDAIHIRYISDFHPIGTTDGYAASIIADDTECELVVWPEQAEPFIRVFGDKWYGSAFSGKQGVIEAVRKNYNGINQLVFYDFER